MRKFSSLLSTAVVASLFVVATSCKDDDVVPKTKTDLLTGKSWSYDKAQVEISGSFVDVPNYFEGCELDNVITFTKAGVYNHAVGADDCDGDDNSDETGTWKWNSDETILTIASEANPAGTDINIISLTESELMIQFTTIVLSDINFDGKMDSNDAQELYFVLKGK